MPSMMNNNGLLCRIREKKKKKKTTDQPARIYAVSFSAEMNGKRFFGKERGEGGGMIGESLLNFPE